MIMNFLSHRDYELAHPAPPASKIDLSRESNQNKATDTFSFLFLYLMVALVVLVCFSKSKIFCILFFLCNWN